MGGRGRLLVVEVEMEMLIGGTPAKMTFLNIFPSSDWRRTGMTPPHLTKPQPLHCIPIQQVQEQKVDSAILCEPCNGKGWLLCDFCEGQKTNVQAENKRIYRRCPSCKAVGYVLCSKCKVFKCVTFPDYGDGEDITF